MNEVLLFPVRDPNSGHFSMLLFFRLVHAAAPTEAWLSSLVISHTMQNREKLRKWKIQLKLALTIAGLLPLFLRNWMNQSTVNISRCSDGESKERITNTPVNYTQAKSMLYDEFNGWGFNFSSSSKIPWKIFSVIPPATRRLLFL